MGKVIKKAGILCVVFLASAALFFIFGNDTAEKSDTVYAAMEEATLPLVYADMFESDSNVLFGYMQEMSHGAADDVLTVLPADRKLELRVAGYGESMLSLRYEIRSLDLERLVERTEVKDWTEQDGFAKVKLPIQNLLTKENQYLLHIMMETERHGLIHYYTRIMWTDKENVAEMVEFAREFSRKTFDYDEARSLTTYLESNGAEDDASLGHVSIRSTFNQITWSGLDMELEGPMQVTLKEVDGIMANVQVDYVASRDSGTSQKEYYEVADNFTMKMGPERIFLMDFERSVNQIFDGNADLFSGKRILLGIGNLDQITVQKSEDKKTTVFRFNRDLWLYRENGKEGEAVRLFTFRDENDESIRSSRRNHDVKIISVSDNGNVDFMVYGYMNRGKHEGLTGISMYRYRQNTNEIEESFFLPVSASFESIRSDVERLAAAGGTEMLYFYLNHAIYGVDLNSREYMVMADSLEEGSLAVSSDGTRAAWQDENGLYQSKVIHLMDLKTGRKTELTNSEGAVMRTLGFVNNDFIYGLAREDDLWVVHGRVQSLPMYALEIIDENMEVQTRYEKTGRYLDAVHVEEGRIHMNRLQKSSAQRFIQADTDTIVCNEEVTDRRLEGVGWFASQDRRQLYFVQMDKEIGQKKVTVSLPKRISSGGTEYLRIQVGETAPHGFYAYGTGKLLGVFDNFSEAVAMAYDSMGYVTDPYHQILWNRTDRGTSRTIREPKTAASPLIGHLDELTGSGQYDDIVVLDARGCILNQVLYFIDKGCPVLAYRDDGSYLLLYGYDQFNVSIYDPSGETAYKMGLGDGAAYFQNMDNDFICFLKP